MKAHFKSLIFVLMILIPTAGFGNDDIAFWRLVASSHLIAEGKITVPVDLIRSAGKTGDHVYLPVAVAVHNIYKGSLANNDLTFRYYTATEQYSGLTREQLVALHEREAILFLQSSGKNYYLAAYSPQTVQAASEDLTSKVRLELELQEQLIRDSDLYFATHDLPLESQVALLVKMMVDRATQPGEAQAIYNTLIGLGVEAMPAIIKHMDDARRLAIRKITLEPMAGGEGLIHYGPDVVTDVMSIVLTRITGQDLTQIYNGGTTRQRQAAVRIWKVYERRRNKAL